jgi:hypothetical protein
MKYGLVVFKKGKVSNNNLHGKKCSQIVTQMSGCNIDAPPNSLMDSIVSLKVKTLEGEGVGMRSLVCSILRVKRCAGALGWD